MLRQKILDLVKEYHKETFIGKVHKNGVDTIRYAGRVFDENELVSLVDASLDFWLTEGRYCQEFCEKISDYLGVGNVLLTNSGSSANLLAVSALTSKKLGDRRLVPGDEVVTVAAGFPSTVTPIVQNGLVPVFVDVDIPTYNINIESLEKAVSGKTRAVFIAHTLGNPFNVDAVKEICRRHGLWLVEDNCDAFGSKYKDQYTATFGDIATISFYPAHHITTGEGGAVVTNDDNLARIITSFKDWGRDCYCQGGENNTCGKRFTQQFGTLPVGYDHKYVYSELGYNLKMTEMQAAIGSAQMEKLEYFSKRRRENFNTYREMLGRYSQYLILPEATEGADPSWFSFIVSVKEDAPFTRNQLVRFLNENKIETRNIFAGNILRQPGFMDIFHRTSGELKNTDFIMNNTFFLGTYPGMTADMITYISEVVEKFVKTEI
ncbi:MAG: lipopolysaccharide biosynthesis protein RfbH [Oligoflexales bacterium]|nr:lipopolysaccharide biosynthesis protein RfbH [Oligoflexales bacterium]